MTKLRLFALAGGPLLCAGIMAIPSPEGLSLAGQAALAVLAFCMTWWLFTPVALTVTSLVGLALLPALGALPTNEALALFGNQAVFFVIGVFLVAAVMLKTGLSSRITLVGLRRFSHSEDVLCTAVLMISWALCAVMVSHAVAAIMLPIVIEIIRNLGLGPRSRTARRLLLSMAWGTVAGSNLTLLSSARATLALELYRGFLGPEANGTDPIGFLRYSLGAAPLALVSLILAGIVLRVFFPPEGLNIRPAVEQLDRRVQEMGPMTRREKTTALVIIAMVATMVIAGPRWLGVVALLFSGVLFALQTLRWEDAEANVNWGVVFMYGGAIAVGTALYRTGASAWLVDQVVPEATGPWLTLAAMGVMSAGFTEVVSNSAVIALLLPVGLPMAEQVGMDPTLLAWMVPVSAGFAFMLPTSTPALAMVFGTGYLRIKHTLPGLLVTGLSLLTFFAMVAWLWPLIGLPGVNS